MRFCAWIFAALSLFFYGCSRAPEIKKVSLLHRLEIAEKIPHLQVLLFGAPASQPLLVRGWADPEKEASVPFRWITSTNPVFLFHVNEIAPRYLHLRMKSFFENHATVFVNNKPVSRITVGTDPQTFTIPLPADLSNQTNTVELRFQEIRTPDANDKRSLAAAGYYAVMTPSRYLEQFPQPYDSDSWMKVEPLLIRNKKVPAVTLNTGASLRFHEKLPPAARLKFGTYYSPSNFAEEDEYARFAVILKAEGKPEQILYQRTFTESTIDFQTLSLPEGIHRIELQMERNSLFDGGKAAWLDPVLEIPAAPEQPHNRQALEEIRRAHRNSNILIIVLDAASAGHFGCYGYNRNTTPVVDKLAAEGIVFERAYCQAVYTQASTASLMSGLFPFRHRIVNRKARLPETTITMAETLKAAGYRTGTFVANGNASGIFGMTQGFEEKGEVFRDPNKTGWGLDITNRFIQWLDQIRYEKRPFFAYLHYREPHAPFNPPPGWAEKFVDPSYQGIKDASYETRIKINMGQIDATEADRNYIISLYDANLAYGDFEVGRVVKKLKALGLYDKTSILVTSDHGEAFWEHNFQGHNSQLYEESIRIPFVFKFAGIHPSSRRINTPVRTIDIYPTLVDLLNLPLRNLNLDGRSFLPALASQVEAVPVLSQTLGERVYAYLEGPYKYIVSPYYKTEELYNLIQDPQEKRNLINDRPVMAGYLRSRFHEMVASAKKSTKQQRTETAIVDETARENLRALGYVDEN